MSEPIRLVVALMTCNNMRTLSRVLDSVTPIADRIVAVDSGSTDGTIELLQQRGCEVVRQPWLGYVGQRRKALEQAHGARWVLLLDSDESLEPDLQQAVRRAVAEDDASFAGWRINRKIWFLGGWLNHLFQPEWRLRLVRPEHAKVVGVEPHDEVVVDGRAGKLGGVCRHDSWADVYEMARRQVGYAETSARQGYSGGRWYNLLLSPIAALIRHLVIERGLLDGRRGLIVALMAAQYKVLKHVAVASRRLEEESREPGR